jgi:RNA recognition motif-containing protein
VSTRLYAGNLPISATADLLAVMFAKFGTVVSVNLDRHPATGDLLAVMFAKFGTVVSVNLDRHPATGASRRGAFVEMRNAVDAARAMEGLNLANFDGRLMSVYRAVVAVQPRAE